jgi:hypothetical protein
MPLWHYSDLILKSHFSDTESFHSNTRINKTKKRHFLCAFIYINGYKMVVCDRMVLHFHKVHPVALNKAQKTELWRYKHYISCDIKATTPFVLHSSSPCAAVKYVCWNCGQLFIHRAIDEKVSDNGRIIINREKTKCLERNLPQCPQQMSYGLPLERTPSSAVRNRWLTAWDIL